MKTFQMIAAKLNCTLVMIKYSNFGHTSKGYDIVSSKGYILYSFIPYFDGKANIWKVVRKTPDDMLNRQPNIIYGTAREVASRKDYYYSALQTSYKLSGFPA